MRLLLRIILTTLLGWLGMLFLPIPGIWATSITAFIVGLLLHKKVRTSRYRKEKAPKPFSFWGAFLAVLILWAGWAFLIDIENGSVLSSRMLGVIRLPIEAPWFLVLISGLMAAAVAGLAGLAGNWLGDAVRN